MLAAWSFIRVNASGSPLCFDGAAQSWLPNRFGFNGPKLDQSDFPSKEAPIQKEHCGYPPSSTVTFSDHPS
jgi:hypothetical protein